MIFFPDIFSNFLSCRPFDVLQSRNLRVALFPKGRMANEEQDFDKPFKYFGSEAEQIRSSPAPPSDQPEYSPYIIAISLVVFMGYFCIFREENDIDELLGRDLFDHFGEEASRLKKAYDYNIKHNLPTHEIVSRLREIGAPTPPQQ